MLPGRFPVRRLGAASLALSAGVLMVFAAPAPTAAAEPRKCVKGHDPQSSMKDIECQFHNNVEAIKNKIDEANGKETEKPADKAESDKSDKGDKGSTAANKPKKPKKPAKPSGPRNSPPIAPQTSVRAPSGFTVQPPKNPGVRPPESVADALPEQPQVADAPQAEPVLALPETHLVAPVAATRPLEGDSARAMWAAGASAAITAVVMGQFSLIGSRLRRRARGSR
ncbi:hypothetical protein [Actinocorallia populi]|uniref:hypothetical protein n=1 Tax=Actinocorallia populi TaxID=2079200 RepID=UPI000D086C37|nr:hypothetical protein [Actinocorallia populi]